MESSDVDSDLNESLLNASHKDIKLDQQCNNAFFVLCWKFLTREEHTNVSHVYTCQLLTTEFSTFTALFVFTVHAQYHRVQGRYY